MSPLERVGGSGRRAELRRARRRRQRRLLVVAMMVMLAVLLAATVLALTRGAGSDHAPVASPARTQSTVLLQVQSVAGEVVASALLAHDPAGHAGAVVLLPPQVIVSLPGTGSLQLGRALVAAPPERSRSAVGDLLGVTVDSGWVVGATELAALIDKLGGVQVIVDVQVVAGRAVVLTPGDQRLDGQHALAYLGYLAPGEPEQARLARLQGVLDGLLNALPKSTAQVTATLGSLGSGSAVSASVPALASVLTGLAADDRSSALQYNSLPVVPIDSGNGAIAFRADPDGVRAMVDRLLAQSVPAGTRESGNRVLVLNGVGTPGIGEKVRGRLVAAGLVFVASRNNATFGVTRSRVLIQDATPADEAMGRRVATALGLPPDSVETAAIGTLADVVVVVGADFAGA
ncbi:MAG: hypothetical protein NVS3B26_25370 [Mycobacteriales bacterium]